MLNNYKNCPKNVCEKSKYDLKHYRTRSSILIEFETNKNILIDVSMDFRHQALRERINKIDAILITHCHFDHIGGIPDIRSYTSRNSEPLKVFGSFESNNVIKKTFSYIFDPNTFWGGGIPKLSLIDVYESFELFGEKIVPIFVEHANLKGCFGYRIKNLAYIPDIKSISLKEKEKLNGLDLLILNCLREEKQHVSHLILGQSIELAREIMPKKCFFIHMCHDIDYQLDKAKLDSWMDFSYDGLMLDI